MNASAASASSAASATISTAVAAATVYEPVIGLEVHAQLLTRTKIFCGCRTSFGDAPNTHTCPVCLGLPGALPVLNARAVRLAVRAALALGLTLHERSVFARKNYFYPDSPKGYQISQFDEPYSTGGSLTVKLPDGSEKTVGITRIHLEEDAGKTSHGVGGDSLVDLNRAGTALIEIVGEPDLRSGVETVAYLTALRDVLMFIGVNDGNLEEGSFRCDVNVSLRPRGTTTFGTRCEIKNVNSFRFVQRAIEVEIARQTAILQAGGAVVQETRGWNEAEGKTFSLRSKEDAHDYRYFPDPDLPPLIIDAALVEEERSRLPDSPVAHRARMIDQLGLSEYAAGVLTGHPRIATFFEDARRGFAGDPRKLANFLQTEILADVTTNGLDASFPVSPDQLRELLALVEAGTISGKQAKEVYQAIAGTSIAPGTLVAERGMAVQSDEGALLAIVQDVLAANEKNVASYRAGKTALFGFFVGAVMKQTKGSANPAVVNTVLKRLLESLDKTPRERSLLRCRPSSGRVCLVIVTCASTRRFARFAPTLCRPPLRRAPRTRRAGSLDRRRSPWRLPWASAQRLATVKRRRRPCTVPRSPAPTLLSTRLGPAAPAVQAARRAPEGPASAEERAKLERRVAAAWAVA